MPLLVQHIVPPGFCFQYCCPFVQDFVSKCSFQCDSFNIHYHNFTSASFSFFHYTLFVSSSLALTVCIPTVYVYTHICFLLCRYFIGLYFLFADTHYLMTPVQQGGYLIIKDVEPTRDQGMYTCIVRSRAGEEARRDVQLNVNSK